MKAYLATWNEDNQGEALNKVGCSSRLMSFFFFKSSKGDFLERYEGKALKEMNEDGNSDKEV